MRKTSSTGRISDYNPHLQKMKERFSHRFKKNPENSKYLKLLQISNYPLESFSNTKTTKTINRNILSNQNQNQNELYDELMHLKRKVNNLNAKISFAKSQKRKKDMQINSKKKELANYMSDIQMSKDISPINIDKLKDSNMISLIKKEYYKVKRLLNKKINEAKDLEIYIKKAKPNIEMKKNEDLENKLRILVMKYSEIQRKNNEDSQKLYLLRNLAQIFQKNHSKIEEMKNLLYQTENNINRLRTIADDMNIKNYKNNEILKKQNISKTNVNKHIEHLMNEKKNKEEIVKMRAIYEKKIKTLEEELDGLKDKCNKNDKEIDSLKEDLVIIEKFKNVDQFKLKQFNYENLKKIDKDPLENVNSKILLLNSLIEESNNNIKRYKDGILEMNEQLKEMGYEPFEVNDLFNDGNNTNKTNEDKKNEIDEVNKEINSDIKNNNNKEEENNQNQKVENEKEKENMIIKNNLESDGNKYRFESTKEEETKNENNNIKPETNKDNAIKEQINKNTSEENNDNDNNNNNNNDNNNAMRISENENNNESIEQRISSNNNKAVVIDSNNNNNLDSEINTNNSNNNTKKLFTEEEFSEFTFVLVKNLEAKKITSDIAKEKIILLTNKIEIITNETYIQQMSQNILSYLNNKNEESIQKLDKWLYFLLNISENSQKIMTEKFLSLLTNIKIYSSDEELILSKKVKKYLLPKKEILLSKLEPFKNKYISFIFLKQIMEEQKIEMRDEYSQYLFYAMKKFDDPSVSLYDLKVKNLFDILNNTENDSKMDEESDVEITNEEFTAIITNFVIQLMNYLNKNKVTLRDVIKDLIQTLNVEEEDTNQEKIEIVLVESFLNRMKEIGIQINNDIETFCIYNRYKLTDEYEIISVNLLEKELENFRQMNINGKAGIGINNIVKKDKVMEKVQEETEDNISNN